VLRIATERPELALTFDDGPNPAVTPRLLAQLEAEGHRATFFVIGERARSAPELLGEIVRRGHSLANHSLRHSYLTTFASPGRLAAELEEAGALLKAAGSSSRWFRPPVGLLSPRVAAAAKRAGLELLAWTESARDGTAAADVERGLRRLEPHLRPGAILVLHDGAVASERVAPELLRRVLERLRQKGLKSVTLDELTSNTSA
jgi:peptidoglycan/xylan/chitin deacetylase (PgdA/CDA1 family)